MDYGGRIPSGGTITSSYLQEKLQKGRSLESQRSASRMADHLSSSLEQRATQSSPLRATFADSHHSASGSDDNVIKKKAVGLKDIDQVRPSIPSLH